MDKTIKKTNILPTITTTRGSDWKGKISEINDLELEEIALFLTGLGEKEREDLYKSIKDSTIKSIPYVHLRSDMKITELDWLTGNYGTKTYNIHTANEYPLLYDYSKYRKRICIENVYYPLNEAEIKNYAGICLDFSHLENDRLINKKVFNHNIKVIEKFGVGCNHISAIKKETWLDTGDGYNKNKLRHDFHDFKNLSEFDYLNNYPLGYFSEYIALELENNIREQIKARDYIINFLLTRK